MSEPHPLPTDPRFRDITGRRFGKLTVLHYAGRSLKKYSLWHCRCDCGGTTDVVSTSLTKGLTKSCTRCPKDRPAERACNKCGKVYPFTEEHFYRHDAFRFGLQPQCRDCIKRRLRTTSRARNKRIRLEILNHYSNGDPRCSCCGERRYEFLSIDHVNGGGRKERQECNVYERIRRQGFPPGFRILCHNCNFARGVYGYCPHERELATPEV